MTREITIAKSVRHLSKGHPLNSFVSVDPLDQTFVHHHDLRLATNLRMDRYWKYEFRVFAVAELEMFLPEPFHVMRVDAEISSVRATPPMDFLGSPRLTILPSPGPLSAETVASLSDIRQLKASKYLKELICCRADPVFSNPGPSEQLLKEAEFSSAWISNQMYWSILATRSMERYRLSEGLSHSPSTATVSKALSVPHQRKRTHIKMPIGRNLWREM
jgi:hypothetical protein